MGDLSKRKGITMKKKWKWMLLLPVVGCCILLGCCKSNSSHMLVVESREPETMIPETDVPEEVDTFSTPEISRYMVHVCGAVNHPGVYELNEGSRIYEAIAMAGGFSEDADEEYLNQAGVIQDGMKIYVPTHQEVENNGTGVKLLNGSWEEHTEGLVNINTATQELLCTLPGIGENKAKKIIAYREEHGVYGKIEDIMNVAGIKEGLFQKIRDSITV